MRRWLATWLWLYCASSTLAAVLCVSVTYTMTNYACACVIPQQAKGEIDHAPTGGWERGRMYHRTVVSQRGGKKVGYIERIQVVLT